MGALRSGSSNGLDERVVLIGRGLDSLCAGMKCYVQEQNARSGAMR